MKIVSFLVVLVGLITFCWGFSESNENENDLRFPRKNLGNRIMETMYERLFGNNIITTHNKIPSEIEDVWEGRGSDRLYTGELPPVPKTLRTLKKETEQLQDTKGPAKTTNKERISHDTVVAIAAAILSICLICCGAVAVLVCRRTRVSGHQARTKRHRRREGTMTEMEELTKTVEALIAQENRREAGTVPKQLEEPAPSTSGNARAGKHRHVTWAPVPEKQSVKKWKRYQYRPREETIIELEEPPV